MLINSDNLNLRTVTKDDLIEVVRMWNFEKGEISLGEAADAINWMCENHKLNQLHRIVHLCLAIFENNTNRIIGWCGLDGRSNNNKISIFYLIDKEYRRKGYATECAKALIENGFVGVKVNRIDGECAKENMSSRRVLEKIGMKRIHNNEDGSLHYIMEINDYN